MVMRWIREAVNNLLAVVPIGGEVVVALLLRRQPVVTAIAGITVDLTLEIVTQICFYRFCLSLLLFGSEATMAARTIADKKRSPACRSEWPHGATTLSTSMAGLNTP
jgi:uncharacterized membrane protein YbhN (UPF0104 family)